MNTAHFLQGLLSFLHASPTPFHATETMSQALDQAGFIRLKEEDEWQIAPDNGYYVIRDHSSIVAFTTGEISFIEHGFRMMGAHTDSPALKVKPNPELYKHSHWQLGVEVYGGVILRTWFDRDLSIAGRVHYLNEEQQIASSLINFERPIATIPSLAIHMDRETNKKHCVNEQTQLSPILLQCQKNKQPNFKTLLLNQVNLEHQNAQEILDYDLYFYDTQLPILSGFNEEFINSARIDNLVSCYIGLISMLQSARHVPTVLACYNHEEVGSESAAGAASCFLESVMKRLTHTHDDFSRCMAKSMLVSLDGAHALHPNFIDKHDDQHAPILNHGPVVKFNAKQRYATSSETASMIRYIANSINENIQSFVMRNDLTCGTTIGPVSATRLGVKTIDMGIPQFGMHSIREMAGARDAYSLFRILREFLSLETLPFV